MTPFQAFILGIAVALVPSFLVFIVMVWRANKAPPD